MLHISGTYQNGAVVLDERVDWPEGAPVEVACKVAPSAKQAEDICLDDSKWDDSPAGIRKWIEWIDSFEPLFRGEQLERFEATLREMREQQKALLPNYGKRIEGLFE